MMRAKAWLLDIGMDFLAAVGSREVIHLLDVPVSYPVPRTPKYCNSVVSWQGKLLPVMDIATRLGGEHRGARFMAVVGYLQQDGDEVSYGAIPLMTPPRQIEVSDEQACDLPEEMQGLRAQAMSCFLYQDAPVPILNLQNIFTAQPVSD